MFIDRDVLEIIHNFRHNAFSKGTVVEIVNVKEQYDIPNLKELIYNPVKKN
jgi:SulP family sulfate permease